MNKMKRRRTKGAGCVFRRKGTKLLSVKFYSNGKPVIQATHTADHQQAAEYLRQRLAEVAKGEHIPHKSQKVTVADLIEDVFSDYRANSRRSLSHAKRRWRLHLEPFFHGLTSSQVTRPSLVEYVGKRQEQAADIGSINRELSLLRRAFNLGVQNEKIKVMPKFPQYKEKNARQGFADAQQVKRILESGPREPWFPAMIEVANLYCWRKSEPQGMRVSQADFFNRTIRLEPGTTKNGDAREVGMSDGLWALLWECCRGKNPSDFIFTRPDGKVVKDFRRSWQNACIAAGLAHHICPVCFRAGEKVVLVNEHCPQCGAAVCRGCFRSRKLAGPRKHPVAGGVCSNCAGIAPKYDGLLVHDLRRSGVRAHRLAGVSEGTIMKMAGMRTRSIFDRYNITVQADVLDAVRKREAYEQEAVRQQAAAESRAISYNHGYSHPESGAVATVPATAAGPVAKAEAVN